MKKPNLSQSLLKELVDYYDQNVNGCGLVILKKYFEGKSTPQSAVQKLGTYFEYKATEYVRAGDAIPEPEMVYKGTAKEKLAADYEKANQSRPTSALTAHSLVIQYWQFLSFWYC